MKLDARMATVLDVVDGYQVPEDWPAGYTTNGSFSVEGAIFAGSPSQVADGSGIAVDGLPLTFTIKNQTTGQVIESFQQPDGSICSINWASDVPDDEHTDLVGA